MPAHRILVVTSVHPAWAGVRNALKELPAVRVIGQTQRLDTAARVVASRRPALILASGRTLVDQNPERLLGQLRAASPVTKLLVVLDRDHAREWLTRSDLIPSGFVHWSDLTAPGLEACLTAILDRGLWIGNDHAMQQLFQELREPQQPPVASVELKPDEQAVLQLLAAGHTHAEIVASLHLSTTTLTRRIDDLQDRLGVDNTASLLVKAARLGLVA